MEFGLGILPENYRAVPLTRGSIPPRDVRLQTRTKGAVRNRTGLRPEAAGGKKSEKSVRIDTNMDAKRKKGWLL